MEPRERGYLSLYSWDSLDVALFGDFIPSCKMFTTSFSLSHEQKLCSQAQNGGTHQKIYIEKSRISIKDAHQELYFLDFRDVRERRYLTFHSCDSLDIVLFFKVLTLGPKVYHVVFLILSAKSVSKQGFQIASLSVIILLIQRCAWVGGGGSDKTRVRNRC